MKILEKPALWLGFTLIGISGAIVWMIKQPMVPAIPLNKALVRIMIVYCLSYSIVGPFTLFLLTINKHEDKKGRNETN